MRMDRRTDLTKLIVAFRNFANAPKNRDRHAHTYNVTIWRFRVTIFALDTQQRILRVLLRYMSLPNTYKY